jgi:hypothetical protein
MMKPALGAVLAATMLLLGACGGPAPGPVAARLASDPGFVAVGLYQLRYGTVVAAELPVAVARSHGVERRGDLALLNVSVLRLSEGTLPQPVAASVTGTQRSLIGEPRPLEFREISAGGSLSYVATLDIGSPGIIVIELEARPLDGGPSLQASINREFPAR